MGNQQTALSGIHPFKDPALDPYTEQDYPIPALPPPPPQRQHQHHFITIEPGTQDHPAITMTSGGSSIYGNTDVGDFTDIILRPPTPPPRRASSEVRTRRERFAKILKVDLFNKKLSLKNLPKMVSRPDLNKLGTLLKFRKKKFVGEIYPVPPDAERPSPPSKPEVLHEADEYFLLRWDPPAYDGGLPIIGYVIQHVELGLPQIDQGGAVDDTQSWFSSEPGQVTSTEVLLNNLIPGTTYQFRIIAENLLGYSQPGEISDPIVFNPNGELDDWFCPPVLIIPLDESYTVIEHERLVLSIEVTGQPYPIVKWYDKNEQELSKQLNPEKYATVSSGQRRALTISGVELSDAGLIRCIGENEKGFIETKCFVFVEAPPHIHRVQHLDLLKLQNPYELSEAEQKRLLDLKRESSVPGETEEDLIFQAGELARLKFMYSGAPKPNVCVYHEGDLVDGQEIGGNKASLIGKRCSTEVTENLITVKIPGIRRSDRGEWVVRLDNVLGEDMAMVLITVTDRPSPPGKPDVLQLSDNTCILKWDRPYDDGGCPVQGYIVEYYRTEWGVWLKACTTKNPYTKIRDLIPGSKYKFRVKAENLYGISSPSDESVELLITDLVSTLRSVSGEGEASLLMKTVMEEEDEEGVRLEEEKPGQDIMALYTRPTRKRELQGSSGSLRVSAGTMTEVSTFKQREIVPSVWRSAPLESPPTSISEPQGSALSARSRSPVRLSPQPSGMRSPSPRLLQVAFQPQVLVLADEDEEVLEPPAIQPRRSPSPQPMMTRKEASPPAPRPLTRTTVQQLHDPDEELALLLAMEDHRQQQQQQHQQASPRLAPRPTPSPKRSPVRFNETLEEYQPPPVAPPRAHLTPSIVHVNTTVPGLIQQQTAAAEPPKKLYSRSEIIRSAATNELTIFSFGVASDDREETLEVEPVEEDPELLKVKEALSKDEEEDEELEDEEFEYDFDKLQQEYDEDKKRGMVSRQDSGVSAKSVTREESIEISGMSRQESLAEADEIESDYDGGRSRSVQSEIPGGVVAFMRGRDPFERAQSEVAARRGVGGFEAGVISQVEKELRRGAVEGIVDGVTTRVVQQQQVPVQPSSVIQQQQVPVQPSSVIQQQQVPVQPSSVIQQQQVPVQPSSVIQQQQQAVQQTNILQQQAPVQANILQQQQAPMPQQEVAVEQTNVRGGTSRAAEPEAISIMDQRRGSRPSFLDEPDASSEGGHLEPPRSQQARKVPSPSPQPGGGRGAASPVMLHDRFTDYIAMKASSKNKRVGSSLRSLSMSRYDSSESVHSTASGGGGGGAGAVYRPSNVRSASMTRDNSRPPGVVQQQTGGEGGFDDVENGEQRLKSKFVEPPRFNPREFNPEEEIRGIKMLEQSAPSAKRKRAKSMTLPYDFVHPVQSLTTQHQPLHHQQQHHSHQQQRTRSEATRDTESEEMMSMMRSGPPRSASIPNRPDHLLIVNNKPNNNSSNNNRNEEEQQQQQEHQVAGIHSPSTPSRFISTPDIHKVMQPRSMLLEHSRSETNVDDDAIPDSTLKQRAGSYLIMDDDVTEDEYSEAVVDAILTVPTTLVKDVDNEYLNQIREWRSESEMSGEINSEERPPSRDVDVGEEEQGDLLIEHDGRDLVEVELFSEPLVSESDGNDRVFRETSPVGVGFEREVPREREDDQGMMKRWSGRGQQFSFGSGGDAEEISLDDEEIDRFQQQQQHVLGVQGFGERGDGRDFVGEQCAGGVAIGAGFGGETDEWVVHHRQVGEEASGEIICASGDIAEAGPVEEVIEEISGAVEVQLHRVLTLQDLSEGVPPCAGHVIDAVLESELQVEENLGGVVAENTTTPARDSLEERPAREEKEPAFMLGTTLEGDHNVQEKLTEVGLDTASADGVFVTGKMEEQLVQEEVLGEIVKQEIKLDVVAKDDQVVIGGGEQLGLVRQQQQPVEEEVLGEIVVKQEIELGVVVAGGDEESTAHGDGTLGVVDQSEAVFGEEILGDDGEVIREEGQVGEEGEYQEEMEEGEYEVVQDGEYEEEMEEGGYEMVQDGEYEEEMEEGEYEEEMEEGEMVEEGEYIEGEWVEEGEYVEGEEEYEEEGEWVEEGEEEEYEEEEEEVEVHDDDQAIAALKTDYTPIDSESFKFKSLEALKEETFEPEKNRAIEELLSKLNKFLGESQGDEEQVEGVEEVEQEDRHDDVVLPEGDVAVTEQVAEQESEAVAPGIQTSEEYIEEVTLGGVRPVVTESEEDIEPPREKQDAEDQRVEEADAVGTEIAEGDPEQVIIVQEQKQDQPIPNEDHLESLLPRENAESDTQWRETRDEEPEEPVTFTLEPPDARSPPKEPVTLGEPLIITASEEPRDDDYAVTPAPPQSGEPLTWAQSEEPSHPIMPLEPEEPRPPPPNELEEPQIDASQSGETRQALKTEEPVTLTQLEEPLITASQPEEPPESLNPPKSQVPLPPTELEEPRVKPFQSEEPVTPAQPEERREGVDLAKPEELVPPTARKPEEQLPPPPPPAAPKPEEQLPPPPAPKPEEQLPPPPPPAAPKPEEPLPPPPAARKPEEQLPPPRRPPGAAPKPEEEEARIPATEHPITRTTEAPPPEPTSLSTRSAATRDEASEEKRKQPPPEESTYRPTMSHYYDRSTRMRSVPRGSRDSVRTVSFERLSKSYVDLDEHAWRPKLPKQESIVVRKPEPQPDPLLPAPTLPTPQPPTQPQQTPIQPPPQQQQQQQTPIQPLEQQTPKYDPMASFYTGRDRAAKLKSQQPSEETPEEPVTTAPEQEEEEQQHQQQPPSPPETPPPPQLLPHRALRSTEQAQAPQPTGIPESVLAPITLSRSPLRGLSKPKTSSMADLLLEFGSRSELSNNTTSSGQPSPTPQQQPPHSKPSSKYGSRSELARSKTRETTPLLLRQEVAAQLPVTPKLRERTPSQKLTTTPHFGQVEMTMTTTQSSKPDPPPSTRSRGREQTPLLFSHPATTSPTKTFGGSSGDLRPRARTPAQISQFHQEPVDISEIRRSMRESSVKNGGGGGEPAMFRAPLPPRARVTLSPEVVLESDEPEQVSRFMSYVLTGVMYLMLSPMLIFVDNLDLAFVCLLVVACVHFFVFRSK